MITMARHSRSGFSLIEILIALTIITILGVIVVPSLFKYRSDAQLTSAKGTLKNLNLAIQSFSTDTGSSQDASRSC